MSGRTVLEHVVNRVRASCVDEVIVAVPNGQNINPFGVNIFYGSEENVLGRYYECAKSYFLDAVVRITADCPLVPTYEINRCINAYLDNDFDYVTNRPSVPDGWDVEVFSYEALEDAYNSAEDKYDLEHVTQWIKRNCKTMTLDAPKLSLDNKQDLEELREFYELERKNYPDHRWDRIVRN